MCWTQLDDSGPYEGWYVYATGRIKLIDGGCLLSAPSAQMEVRLWTFDDGAGGETYGGEITGTVYPVVLCILNGRANLTLEYDRADRGFALYDLTCDADRCDVYSGSFWVALGFGWCSPKSWDSWHDKGSNWWDDTWCYTFGAHVDLAYFDPPGGAAGWYLNPVPAAE